MSPAIPQVVTCPPHHRTEGCLMQFSPAIPSAAPEGVTLGWIWLGASTNERGVVVATFVPILSQGRQIFLPHHEPEKFESLGLAVQHVELPRRWAVVQGRLRQRPRGKRHATTV